MIRDSRFHGRRNGDRAMQTAEVVVGEVQVVRGPQPVPSLAEAIRQSAHLHSDGEILALHNRRERELEFFVNALFRHHQTATNARLPQAPQAGPFACPGVSTCRIRKGGTIFLTKRLPSAYFLTTWPRPSRISFPLKCALSTRLDASAFSPRCGSSPL